MEKLVAGERVLRKEFNKHVLNRICDLASKHLEDMYGAKLTGKEWSTKFQMFACIILTEFEANLELGMPAISANNRKEFNALL